jgi:integrase
VDVIVKKYLEKHKEFKTHPHKNRLFFWYHNVVYNRNLKELQNFAGITQTLTSHLARHTCITLLINDFSLPIEKAQMIAGHSKIEMTRKYLRQTERDLSEAAKKINWN